MNLIKKSILFAVLLFSGCYEDRIEPIISYSANYFPMQTGNWWIYQTDSLDLTVEITRIKVFNSNYWYEIIKTFDGEVDTMFCKAGSNEKVFIFFDNRDELFLDFDRPDGQIWESFGNFYSKINRRGLNIQTPAGNFENVIEIFTDNYHLSDLYEFNKYAPGVGLVETIGFRRIFRLKNAFVNGITYP